ncbi:uncharacterized protein C8Q71DRAFT_734684 [Rhodofomes roseus]|uniref:Ribosomal protein S21 n=1 Tax=Rhodofomes roseus TaxID=34475 RepID=A0A4Y9YQL3_9APHY|nr:uncharacterized protein C8Q71DRAFT_734684 [Rhodofomes roseus]KAH9842814.1 hypothetical protein C8Q71DRAFT_734684 [Rhodofomes roseus]TFY63977.1 hypothetical protein EVJ58_g2920 [Rhodofomes roseus]
MFAAFARCSSTPLRQARLPSSTNIVARICRSLSSQPANPFLPNVAGSSVSIKPKWTVEENTGPISQAWVVMQGSAARQHDQPEKSPEEIWQDRETRTVANLPKPHGSKEGRSTYVFNGDVASAFGRLARIVKNNRMFLELRQYERHERRGAKRSRLKSERWRRRFAHEVRMKVKLVNAIRARGA